MAIRLSCLLLVLFSLSAFAAEEKKEEKPVDKQAELETEVTQGALRIAADDGTVVECPLKHTDVQADISGFIARVKVTQTFVNPTKEKIEAVYVFPLPHESAVDDMTMVIGDRRIVGIIKRRAEARQIYEDAVSAGQTAALLEQERPNIFTQTVGNIEPGQEVKIEISYVDVLNYDIGEYEFHFPMVVGPRYNPGAPIGSPGVVNSELQGKVAPPAPDTTRVPDASRISPPVLKPGFRNGHDISLSVNLDAGVPVQDLVTPTHRADLKKEGDRKAAIKLSEADSIPNKDFVLRYKVVGEKPEMAMLAHTGNHSPDARRLGDGYFMLMIQPKEDERLKKSPPREIVFLVDVSGSMSGPPTELTKKTMEEMLKLCRPIDTVQVVTFASQAEQLFEKPLPVEKESIKKAVDYSRGFKGGGGTEMLKGIKLAIDQPIDKERVRIVVMLTDGYIGNEAEIIEHVGKHAGDQIRFWALGIGSSPNMFLIDGVAKQGGGMGKRLGLEDDINALSQEVISRIQRAQLAKIKIDWGDFEISETYPERIPELWAGRPVVVYGRYRDGGKSEVTVSGSIEGEAASWPLAVSLPMEEPGHDVLAKVWARKKIESLMQQSYYQGSPAVEEMVTALALDYRLMSQYTSFVAVDAKQVDELESPATPPRRMLVPVPLPAGTQWEGFFGEQGWSSPDDLVMNEFDRGLVRQEVQQLKSLEKSVDRAARVNKKGSADLMYRFNTLVDERRFAITESKAYNTNRAYDGLRGGDKNTQYFSRYSPAGETRHWGLNLGAQQHAQGFGGGAAGGLQTFGVPGPIAGRRALRQVEQLQQLQEQVEAIEEHAEILVAKPPQDAAKRAEYRAKITSDYFRALLEGAEANAAKLMEALEAAQELDNAAAIKAIPALEKKLDLVLRDQSLAEALAQIGKAAGISISLTEGSIEDAASLVGEQNTRIDYLDLRGATALQALDWTLRPLRLTWRQEEGKLIAGSCRRQSGETPWVYDVTLLAFPTEKEVEPIQEKEYKDQLAFFEKEKEEFLAAFRKELGGDEKNILWFSQGQILVIGKPELHAKAAGFIAQLTEGKEKSDFAKKVALRAAAAKESLAKSESQAELVQTAQRLSAFSWPLLAAAADGKVDLEALTQLQIAFGGKQSKALLENSPHLLLRSWWCVAEASRAIPASRELADLTAKAKGLCSEAAKKAYEQLKENPENASAGIQVLYAALADPQWELRGEAEKLLASESKQEMQQLLSAFSQALLQGKHAGLAAQLEKAGNVQGEDLLVLLALACRKAGGDAWSSFRGQSRDLVGGQPLPGSVVVLINRLSGSELPLVARN